MWKALLITKMTKLILILDKFHLSPLSLLAGSASRLWISSGGNHYRYMYAEIVFGDAKTMDSIDIDFFPSRWWMGKKNNTSAKVRTNNLVTKADNKSS
jgi:hypothetical protein